MTAGGPSSVPPISPAGLVPQRRSKTSWRATATAIISTVVVLGGLAWVIVHAPNWAEVQKDFFDGPIFWSSLPGLISAFWTNVKLFLIAEALILPLGLLVAILRGLPGPVFTPVRGLATAYVDVFRAVPGIVVIYVLGFGIPGLGIPGVPNEAFFWAVVALTLIYSAYVSEVYRAGIDSVHPSQDAAARSLGLSRAQSMRHVVLPQAVRRVIPPLLNDFIGLQKDTALVGVLGVVEAFNQTQIDSSATFTFGSYLASASLFVALTIPLARLTDWLIVRDRRRRQAGRLV
ncbi:MAG: amino acid ABC transporter permease [Chloroflexota bacterium]